MKTRLSLHCTFLCLFCGLALSLHGDDGWETVMNKNGITVYLRAPGVSKIRECKGTMILEGVTLSSLLAVMDDTGAYPQWMHHCCEAKLLQKVSLFERVVYLAQKFPFGLSDRDLVNRSFVSQDPASKAITIRFIGEPEYLPPVKGRVRITKFKGHWLFRPVTQGKVAVEYYLHMDPGGSIPAWMVNLGLPDAPYRTLLGLRKMVQMEKYRSAVIPQVKEQ